MGFATKPSILDQHIELMNKTESVRVATIDEIAEDLVKTLSMLKEENQKHHPDVDIVRNLAWKAVTATTAIRGLLNFNYEFLREGANG